MKALDAMTRLALRSTCGAEPTVGAIAAEAGQSYLLTQEELKELALDGFVEECPRVKADSHAVRYRLTEPPIVPALQIVRGAERQTADAMRYLGNILKGNDQ